LSKTSETPWEKHLGALPQTPLRNFLKKVPKNLKNFSTKAFHAFAKKVFARFFQKAAGCGTASHDLDLAVNQKSPLYKGDFVLEAKLFPSFSSEQ